jgi:hypothetical protein
LDHDAHPRGAVGDTRRLAVGDRTPARQRLPAPPHRVDQLLDAADVQKRLVLTREAGLWQVLGHGAGPDSNVTRPEPLVGADDLAKELVGKRAGRRPNRIVGRRRDAEPVRHPLARPDQLAEAGGLATHIGEPAGIDLGEPHDGSSPGPRGLLLVPHFGSGSESARC